MKIKDLLLEDESIESMYERIIKSNFFYMNWKPWFDKVNLYEIDEVYENIKDHIPVLYHGGKLKENEINHIMYRERPMDTQNVIHNTINRISEEELSVSVRAMMFASRSESLASEYGNPSIVIALNDDYLFYYSTLVDDMFTSNKVFNFKEYKEGLSEAIDLFYETKETQEVTDRINNHFGSHLKPNFTTYTKKHMANYVDTIFIRVFTSGEIEELSDYERVITESVLVKGYREMFNIMTMAYSMEKISEIEGEEYDKLEKDMYLLTKMLFKALANYKANWIMKDSQIYVDSIQFTEDLDEIDPKTEIMLPEGEYAVLGVGDWSEDDDDLFKLLTYYVKKKGTK